MMIALAAVGFKNGDIAYNKEKIKTVIRDHGNKQVDLILFGETFLQGFDSLSWNYDSDKTWKKNCLNRLLKKMFLSWEYAEEYSF